MVRKPGISEFLRQNADLDATDRKQEIGRLEVAAKELGLNPFSVAGLYYKLRSERSGPLRVRKKQRKSEVQISHVEPKEEPGVEPLTMPLSAQLEKNLEEMGRLVRLILEENARIETEKEGLRMEKDDLQKKLREANLRLEERTLEDLESLAEALPQFPAIYSAVQSAKGVVRAREAGAPEGCPKTCRSSRGVPFDYTRNFLDSFYGFQETEQRQIAKAIRHLDEQGHGHAALRSKRLRQSLPCAPAEAWWSRASDELRFIWDRVQQGGQTVAIRLYGVYRKGDSRLSQTEA